MKALCFLNEFFLLFFSICETALDALGRLVSQPDTSKYPTYILDFLTKILPLREIIVRELMSPEPDQVCSV